jgi:hypothetical protein
MRKNNIDIFDLIDNVIMGIYGITEAEYDYIASKLSEEELQFFCQVILTDEDELISYSDKRKMVELKNKYLNQMKNER